MKNIFLELAPVQYDLSATKTLHFNVQPHQQCFRLHWHERIEFLRIKSGKIYVEQGTDLTMASAGNLILIPPKTLHKGYTLDENVEYDVLMFDLRDFYNETEICKKLLPSIFDGYTVFNTVTSNPEIILCIDSICDIADQGMLEIVSKIYMLINLFLKNELLELQICQKNIVVKRITDYIEKNASHEIDTNLLCREFGYTAAHLCRIFKQTTGIPPMLYLKLYRLELARNKIKNSDASISDIAAECGFSDANYFTRCFKAHFGIPPVKYRKTHDPKYKSKEIKKSYE